MLLFNSWMKLIKFSFYLLLSSCSISAIQYKLSIFIWWVHLEFFYKMERGNLVKQSSRFLGNSCSFTGYGRYSGISKLTWPSYIKIGNLYVALLLMYHSFIL